MFFLLPKINLKIREKHPKIYLISAKKGYKMAYIDELNAIWLDVKEYLCETMARRTVELWFGDFKVADYKDDVIIFSTESEFKYNKAKAHHLLTLAEAFESYFGHPQKVDVIFVGRPAAETISKQFNIKIGDYENGELIVKPEEKEKKEKTEKIEEKKAEATEVIGRAINFQYNFDNFIVSTSNNFAHAACEAVARNPADKYNPLFIYGPSGLGKTHLMCAIVNEIKRKDPSKKVVFIKGEDFTNEMIECLSNQTMNEFHDKYRKCDILLIDDIQFIGGKTATQEEFFHTFNTLHENNSQIVLSSDRPPKDISTLEDRLKTRFEWGLIADIQPPDLELRIAIIKKKAEQAEISLSDEVSTFLAENLRSNIRQIEGTIKKLSAIVFLEGKEITMEIAAACLQEITGGVIPTQVVIDKIFTFVEKKFGVDKKTILGKSRAGEVALARHLTIYLIRELTDMSYPNIGKIFDKNHSTMISSCMTIEKKMSGDMNFYITVSELKKDIEMFDLV